MNTSRFCDECGAALPPNPKFCEECGKAVAGAPAGLTNFTRLRELYDQAQEVEPARREKWLEQQCQGDPVLLAELRGMMPREEDSFLATPAAMPPSMAPPSQPPPSAADMIGPYRVLRELGRGGMGVVYLAVRDDGAFRKNVALKVLLREQVTPEFVQRFKQERQVLAAMDHPNVARILDGGDGPDGMPYYVMEYVEGLAIDRYCDEHRLSLSGRIKIFQQVCQAVHYLHQNSILHRDLKPGNILVSNDGVVKLLDFGIAKVVGAGAYSNPDVTSVQGYPMTPTYASPEQIQGATLQKTSDIYSLGVILYLLLTGRPPYADWDDKKAKLAARQAPPSPSGNIREDLRVTPESTAQLRKAMLGELDSIILMALRYEAKERYQASSDLASDLQSFLDGHSVAAHRGTVAGRSVKLIRRQRMLVAAMLGFLVLGGFGFWQWRRAETQRSEVAAREAQLRSLLEQLESGVEPAKADAEKIKDLQALQKAFAAEFPKVAAAQPERSAQHVALLERGVKYLDRVAATGPRNADLGVELADAYQQLAVLQSAGTNATAARATAVKTYQKAAEVLNACVVLPGDTRVGDRLTVVRQRIQSLGGGELAGPAAVPANEPVEPARIPAAVAAVPGSPAPAKVVRAPALDQAPAAGIPEPAPAPRAETPAAPAPAAVSAEMQDRMASAEARVAIAETSIEPIRRTLESQGQTLAANTLSDLSAMRLRLGSAKRHLAAGNEAAAKESLAAAQAFADRVLKSVGR